MGTFLLKINKIRVRGGHNFRQQSSGQVDRSDERMDGQKNINIPEGRVRDFKYLRMTSEITYVPTTDNMLPEWGYTIYFWVSAYTVSVGWVHDMFFEGAYYGGTENLVAPRLMRQTDKL